MGCDFHYCKERKKNHKTPCKAPWIPKLHVENHRFKKKAKNRNCAEHWGWTEVQLYSASRDTSDKWITINAKLWFTKFSVHNMDIIMDTY